MRDQRAAAACWLTCTWRCERAAAHPAGAARPVLGCRAELGRARRVAAGRARHPRRSARPTSTAAPTGSRHDARPDLLMTAWAVLELGGDVARSAAELHIHRTTLYYRLDRIAEVTGVDLRTGADRLDLQLALRLAAYRRAATPIAASTSVERCGQMFRVRAEAARRTPPYRRIIDRTEGRCRRTCR